MILQFPMTEMRKRRLAKAAKKLEARDYVAYTTVQIYGKSLMTPGPDDLYYTNWSDDT